MSGTLTERVRYTARDAEVVVTAHIARLRATDFATVADALEDSFFHADVPAEREARLLAALRSLPTGVLWLETKPYCALCHAPLNCWGRGWPQPAPCLTPSCVKVREALLP